MALEAKIPAEQELLKNEVPFMRAKDQEEKIPIKGENTQNEETDSLCLGSSTHSFIAPVAKLEAVQVPDFLGDWLDQKASVHSGSQ